MGKRFVEMEKASYDVTRLQFPKSLHGPVVTTDEYAAAVSSMVDGLENTSEGSRMADLSSALRNLMQRRCNPPPVLSWTIIAAEKSISLDMTKSNSVKTAKEILNFARRMFESVKCLTSSTSCGSTALASMAPVLGLLYDVAFLLNGSVGPRDRKGGPVSGNAKQWSKALRKLKDSLKSFVGYIAVCQFKDLEGFRRSPSISLPSAPGSMSEKCPEHLYPKFPLLSKSMRKLLSEGSFDEMILAKVVVVQGILLHLAVELIGHRLTSKSQETKQSAVPSSEFMEDLKSLAVHSVSAAGTSIPELLLDTLREKSLPVLDLLDEKEEVAMRMILFETTVVDRPLFNPYAEDAEESSSDTLDVDHECLLFMKKLFTARKALVFFRSQSMQGKLVSLRKQITCWDVPPTLFRWLKSLKNPRIPMHALQDNQALTKWLASTADKSTFKELFGTALACAGHDDASGLEKTDVDESIPRKDDGGSMFFVDTAGNGETETASPASQAEAAADAEFTAAAKTMKNVSSSKKKKKSKILFNRQASGLPDDTREARADVKARNEDDEAMPSDSDGEEVLATDLTREVELSPSPSTSDEPIGVTNRKRRKGASGTESLDPIVVESEAAGEGESTKQMELLGDEEENSVLTLSRKDDVVELKVSLDEKKSCLTGLKLSKSVKKLVTNGGHMPSLAPDIVGEGTRTQVDLIGTGEGAKGDGDSAEGVTTTVINAEKAHQVSELIPPQKEVSLLAAPPVEEVLFTDKKLSKEADVAAVDLGSQGGADETEARTAIDGHRPKVLSDLAPMQKNVSVSDDSPVEIPLSTGKKWLKSAKKKQRATNGDIRDHPAVAPVGTEAAMLLGLSDAEEVNGGHQGSTADSETRVAADNGTSNLLPVVTPIREDPSGSQGSTPEGTLNIGEKPAMSVKKKKRDLESKIGDLTAATLEETVAEASARQVGERETPKVRSGAFMELFIRAGADGSVRKKRADLFSVQKDASISEGSRESRTPPSSRKSSLKSAKKKKHAMDGECHAHALLSQDVAWEGVSMMQANAGVVEVANDGRAEFSEGELAANAELVVDGRTRKTSSEDNVALVHAGGAKDEEMKTLSSLSSDQPMEREKMVDGHVENISEAPVLGKVDSEATQKRILRSGSTPAKKKRPKSTQGRDYEHPVRHSIMNEVVDMLANVSSADLIDALQTQENGREDAEDFQISRKKIKLGETGSKEMEQKDTASDKVMASPARAQNAESILPQAADGDGPGASKSLATGADILAPVSNAAEAGLEAISNGLQNIHGEVAPGTAAADRDRSTVGGASALVKGTEGRIEDLKKDVLTPSPKVLSKEYQQQYRGQDDNGRKRAKAEVRDLLSATPKRSSRRAKPKDANDFSSDSDTSLQTPIGRISPRRTRSGRELGTPQTPVSKRKPQKKLELQPALQEE